MLKKEERAQNQTISLSAGILYKPCFQLNFFVHSQPVCTIIINYFDFSKIFTIIFKR